MTDTLILGGFTFQNVDFSPPTRMPFGGAQAMVVHKLPGGSRVIDTLGPDEDDITWSGFFFCDNALRQCQQLDSMRAAGQKIQLTFAGMSRQVVIKRFKPQVRRYPHWVEYEISCTVADNPFANASGAAPGFSATASPDTLIGNDLSTAQTASTEGAGAAPAPTGGGVGGLQQNF
jgi:hypothetical protein